MKSSRLNSILRGLVFTALMLGLIPHAEAGDVPASIAVLDSLVDDAAIAKGKVVYVDFWASWCVPCRQSFPWMAKLQREYGDRGLEIVAINVDRDRNAAAKFLAENKATFPVVYDPTGKLAKLYHLEVMPSSFLYGRDGKLKLEKQGFDAKEAESVAARIRELLEEEAEQ